MASTKRQAPTDSTVENDAYKKTKMTAPETEYSAPPVTPQRVVLNPADCDLDFNIDDGGLYGSALHDTGFAYCWSGARANVGIIGGKYCFGCKVISDQPVNMEDTPHDQQHLCRLGISRGDNDVGKLGETEYSFGFGGTGKFANSGKFFDYGERFGVGDTIVCSVNLETNAWAEISFSKNGRFLGTARRFYTGPNKNSKWESALFPHILLKNVVVAVQFSPQDGLVPEEGYQPWSFALRDGNGIVGPSLQNIKDCEVRMMVGLPASGKTTWAEKLVKEHPDKRYILLGTNLALDQMKVTGLLRKNNYGERFEKLMDRATDIFNTLLSRASKTPRNFVIDQTNVYKSARKRKLKPFADFHKIAVVVFPKPEELQSRADKRFREMGKEVPAEAVNSMLENYVLPMSKNMLRTDEYFDEVIFTELSREDSQRCLDEMKRDLRSRSSVAGKSISPYSRESSVRSFSSPLIPNQDILSGFPYGSTGGGSYSSQPQLNYNYQRPDQGYQTPNALYGNYGGYNQLQRHDLGSVSPGFGADLSRSHAMGGSYFQPNVQNTNPISGSAGLNSSFVDEAYVRPRYNSYGGHGGYMGSGTPQTDMQASRHSAFPPPTYPSPYGAPYGTPPPGHPQGYNTPAGGMTPSAPAPAPAPAPGLLQGYPPAAGISLSAPSPGLSQGYPPAAGISPSAPAPGLSQGYPPAYMPPSPVSYPPPGPRYY